MLLDLTLMVGWIVVGVIGAVLLTRKGYFRPDVAPDTSALRTHDVAELAFTSGAFGRFFLLGLCGPIALLAALVLPKRQRHTV